MDGLVVRGSLESWLTGLPVGAPRPAPPVKTALDASPLRAWIGPLALMTTTPFLTIAFAVVVLQNDGSLAGLPSGQWAFPRPSPWALAVIAGWSVVQWALLRGLPGPEVHGPVTPAGVRPTYRANGIAAWVVSHALIVGTWAAGAWSAEAFYLRYGEVLATLNVVALVACGFLYAKGRTFPSSPDAVYTGRFLFDFFQGVELHPRLFGTNLKQLLNCRVSMMGWSTLFVVFALAQIERTGALSTSMAASVAVLGLYLFKFFWWEEGYFHSIDVMHDRLGYYIGWGVLVWVPALYALPAFWLVDHPIAWHPLVAAAMVAVGALAIWVNYDADAQRQRVRATNGATTVWGRPPELIKASYTPADGVRRESLLLVSGWWGVARHFHYVPELILAAAWTVPAGFSHALPWAYVAFLAILLTDRARRDEKRCAAKYGPDWATYTARVPWRMVPGVY